jgi:hypothetical protein
MVDDPTNETRNLPALPGDPGQFIMYQTQDGRTRVECRFQDETIWLSQALMAELYQKDVRTINEHLKSIYSDGELAPDATIRKFRIVRQEGSREVARQIEYYNLDVIISVGYRVKSHRGTQPRMTTPWPRPNWSTRSGAASRRRCPVRPKSTSTEESSRSSSWSSRRRLTCPQRDGRIEGKTVAVSRISSANTDGTREQCEMCRFDPHSPGLSTFS